MDRLLTLADLHNYFSAMGKDQKFSYKENNKPIVVQVDGNLNFAKNENATEGLFPVDLQLAFIGDNLNNSRIPESAMNKALSSAKFRPILGYIYKDNNGDSQFMGHNMHIENGKVVYDEIPIGVISEAATIAYDEEYQKDYAVSKGYIFEEYTDAKEILEREQKCDVSVEIAVRELSYSAKDNILVLDDFYFTGVTILGKDEFTGADVKPAMPGSKITLENFTSENNSVVTERNAIEVLEKIKTALSTFDIDYNSGKEETLVEDLEKFEEVAEEVTTETESTEGEATAENAEDATDVTPTEEVTEEFEADAETETEDEVVEETESEEEETPVEEMQCSVTVNGETKTFAVSLNDKLNALYSLVNETYSEIDDDFYDVVVFEDSKIVEMHGYFRGKSYRQSFKVKKDDYQLVGDRVEITAVWMTADEQAKFNSMRENYSAVSDKLQKYEDEPKKAEILSSQKYSYIAETEEFTTLQEDHFDMSVEDVEKKADEILLSYAENGSLKFSVEEDKKVKSVSLFANKKTNSRYGNLFSK